MSLYHTGTELEDAVFCIREGCCVIERRKCISNFRIQGGTVLSSVAYNQKRVLKWKEGNVGKTYESKEVRFFFGWGYIEKRGTVFWVERLV